MSSSYRKNCSYTSRGCRSSYGSDDRSRSRSRDHRRGAARDLSRSRHSHKRPRSQSSSDQERHGRSRHSDRDRRDRRHHSRSRGRERDDARYRSQSRHSRKHRRRHSSSGEDRRRRSRERDSRRDRSRSRTSRRDVTYSTRGRSRSVNRRRDRSDSHNRSSRQHGKRDRSRHGRRDRRDRSRRRDRSDSRDHSSRQYVRRDRSRSRNNSHAFRERRDRSRRRSRSPRREYEADRRNASRHLRRHESPRDRSRSREGTTTRHASGYESYRTPRVSGSAMSRESQGPSRSGTAHSPSSSRRERQASEGVTTRHASGYESYRTPRVSQAPEGVTTRHASGYESYRTPRVSESRELHRSSRSGTTQYLGATQRERTPERETGFTGLGLSLDTPVSDSVHSPQRRRLLETPTPASQQPGLHERPRKEDAMPPPPKPASGRRFEPSRSSASTTNTGKSSIIIAPKEDSRPSSFDDPRLDVTKPGPQKAKDQDVVMQPVESIEEDIEVDTEIKSVQSSSPSEADFPEGDAILDEFFEEPAEDTDAELLDLAGYGETFETPKVNNAELNRAAATSDYAQVREKYARLMQLSTSNAITNFVRQFVVKICGTAQTDLTDEMLGKSTMRLGASEGINLGIRDVLPLWWERRRDSEAWLTESVIETLVENEPAIPGAHFESSTSLQLYLSGSGDQLTETAASDRLKDAISAAQSGEVPAWGFPMSELSATATRSLFFFNPSRSHWVVVELNCEQKPAILLYNPANTRQKGHAISAAKQEIPLLAQLVSLRTGTRFTNQDWLGIVPVSEPCPQQADINIDCSLFSLFILLHRLHGRDLPPALDDDSARHQLGRWLRERAAVRLTNLLQGTQGPSMFELFTTNPPDLAVPRRRDVPVVPGPHRFEAPRERILPPMQSESEYNEMAELWAEIKSAATGPDDLAEVVCRLFDEFDSVEQEEGSRMHEGKLRFKKDKFTLTFVDATSLYINRPVSDTVLSILLDAEPHVQTMRYIPIANISGKAYKAKSPIFAAKDRALFFYKPGNSMLVVDANFQARTFSVYNPTVLTQDELQITLEQTLQFLKDSFKRFAWKKVELLQLPCPQRPEDSTDDRILCLYVMTLLLHGRTIPDSLEDKEIRVLREVACVRLIVLWKQDQHPRPQKEASASLIRLFEDQKLANQEQVPIQGEVEPQEPREESPRPRRQPRRSAKAAASESLFVPEDSDHEPQSKRKGKGKAPADDYRDDGDERDDSDDVGPSQQKAARREKSNTGEYSCTFCDYEVLPLSFGTQDKRKTSLMLHIAAEHMQLFIKDDEEECVFSCGQNFSAAKRKRKAQYWHISKVHLPIWLEHIGKLPSSFPRPEYTAAEKQSVLDVMADRDLLHPMCGFTSIRESKTPSILIVTRSSSYSPKTWGVPSLFLKQKLSEWLAAYQIVSGDTRTEDEVQAIHQNQTRTRFIPISSKLTDKGLLHHSLTSSADTAFMHKLRAQGKRALYFSTMIHDFLCRAREAPTIISMGLDAFTCNVELLQQWLPDQPPFQFVIMTPKECDGLGQVEADEFYVAIFESTAIQEALSGRAGADPRIVRLLERWDDLHSLKQNLHLRNRLGRYYPSVDNDEENEATDSEEESESADSVDLVI